MKLIHQIRIAFFLVILSTAAGSFIFSALDSQHYLEESLHKKNIDNANLIALSMSQMEKDPTLVDLFISAQFDAGHYRYIGLFDPNGKLMTERVNANSKSIAPIWLIKWLPIKASPGAANIQSGWKQYGTVHVESDVNFAYDKLWNTMRNTLTWVLSIGLITYIVSGWLINQLLRPLDDVVAQAKAIGERRFMTITPPRTPEFRLVVNEMNTLSNRIKETVISESKRLEDLRLKSHYEGTTGLMTRDYFCNSVDAELSHENFNDGALLIFRCANLAEIDKAMGYAKTNLLLNQIGEQLQTACQTDAAMVARMSGTDFAVFYPHHVDEYALAAQLRERLIQITPQSESIQPRYLVVVTKANQQDDCESLFKVLNFILEMSSLSEESYSRVINANSIVASKKAYLTEWRDSLMHALDHQQLKLAQFPVINRQGALMHYESPVRLQLEENGHWLPAGEFIHWAIELDLVTKLDRLVLEQAVQSLKKNKKAICINVSESAMLSKAYMDDIETIVSNQLKKPKLLCFEIAESTVFTHLDAFRAFAARLKAIGCCVGVEHMHQRISRLGELYDIGLDYIKFDAALVRNIDTNVSNKTLLRGLCMIAHSLGITSIAEGVTTQSEIDALFEIGFDGLTGPAIQLHQNQLQQNKEST